MKEIVGNNANNNEGNKRKKKNEEEGNEDESNKRQKMSRESPRQEREGDFGETNTDSKDVEKDLETMVREAQPRRRVQLSLDRKAFVCPICNNLLCEPVVTECGHTFCRGCISQK